MTVGMSQCLCLPIALSFAALSLGLLRPAGPRGPACVPYFGSRLILPARSADR